MKAREVLNIALRMLGYTDSEGTTDASTRIMARALAAVNAVYGDLYYTRENFGFHPCETLEDKICLPERLLFDVMPYGVAAFIAQGESDGDSQQYFMQIYNTKRLGAGKPDRVCDAVPTVYGNI